MQNWLRSQTIQIFNRWIANTTLYESNKKKWNYSVLIKHFNFMKIGEKWLKSTKVIIWSRFYFMIYNFQLKLKIYCLSFMFIMKLKFELLILLAQVNQPEKNQVRLEKIELDVPKYSLCLYFYWSSLSCNMMHFF